MNLKPINIKCSGPWNCCIGTVKKIMKFFKKDYKINIQIKSYKNVLTKMFTFILVEVICNHNGLFILYIAMQNRNAWK